MRGCRRTQNALTQIDFHAFYAADRHRLVVDIANHSKKVVAIKLPGFIRNDTGWKMHVQKRILLITIALGLSQHLRVEAMIKLIDKYPIIIGYYMQTSGKLIQQLFHIGAGSESCHRLTDQLQTKGRRSMYGPFELENQIVGASMTGDPAVERRSFFDQNLHPIGLRNWSNGGFNLLQNIRIGKADFL